MGEGNGVNADGPRPGPAHRERWLLRCPICLSDRNDFYLGGKLGFQMRKCLDCGYIGAAFIEVDEKWCPPD
jgi:hypothetical protein